MSGKTYDIEVTTIEELDKGSLHPPIKPPETDKSQPRLKLLLPASQAGTLLRSYLDSLLICLKLSILSRYNTIHNENQAIFKRGIVLQSDSQLRFKGSKLLQTLETVTNCISYTCDPPINTLIVFNAIVYKRNFVRIYI
jgi:hypothetical protein